MNQRILFFDDSLRLSGVPDERINLLGELMMSCVDRDRFNPVIIDSRECLSTMISRLQEKRLISFSSILDLTGYMTNSIREFFPGIPIFSGLHLTRLRKVSPNLDGVGFILRDDNDIREVYGNLLIIDDVCWSGRTIEEAIRLLRLNERNITIGLLVGNVGNFGEGKPGGVTRLRNLGCTVVSGLEVSTPLDDGFHLGDFILDPALFYLVIEAQRFREREEIYSLDLLLRENIGHLFPHIFSLADVIKLLEEGRVIIRGGLSRKESFFCINPPNWLLPSFSKRTKADILEGRKTELESLFNLFLETQEGSINGESTHYRGTERF